MRNDLMSKKGQVTIFIIIAILIVVAIIAYFIVKEVVMSGVEVPRSSLRFMIIL